MHWIDWLVLIATLSGIAIYGLLKSRNSTTLNEYLRGGRKLTSWRVAFTVMATQASAITFISTTGQGFSDGLSFVQFYFGLPLAMIVISSSFIPQFYKLNVFTAYQYLEQRFDLKTRAFAAIIFLIQRGLAAGITLYAPSIILSLVFDWNLTLTHIFSGILVIIYTTSGGARAVNVTQMLQLLVIMLGMIFVWAFLWYNIPTGVPIWHTAGMHQKLNAIQFRLDWNDRYNVWSGLLGGFFLALAYFGTDQSQVQRYLGAKNLHESRMGLIINGFLKIPMQIFILSCGILLFVFFQFEKTPPSFNTHLLTTLSHKYPEYYQDLMRKNDSIHALLDGRNSPEDQQLLELGRKELRRDVQNFVRKNLPDEEANDRDYIFLYFITKYLPKGLVGLLLAVILCAAMSSISAELNALAGTSIVDIKNRFLPDTHFGLTEVQWSKLITGFWGLVAIGFALYAQLFENLVQFINITGSLFYGTVLGIFLVGFFFPRIKANAVFFSAVIMQTAILLLYQFASLAFLWYNVLSALGIIILGSLFQFVADNLNFNRTSSRGN